MTIKTFHEWFEDLKPGEVRLLDNQEWRDFSMAVTDPYMGYVNFGGQSCKFEGRTIARRYTWIMDNLLREARKVPPGEVMLDVSITSEDALLIMNEQIQMDMAARNEWMNQLSAGQLQFAGRLLRVER